MDRTAATGPYPYSARPRRITHYGSCNRVSWVGLQAVIVLSDGSEVACEHHHGHRTKSTYLSCATKLVAKLNKAVGVVKVRQ